MKTVQYYYNFLNQVGIRPDGGKNFTEEDIRTLMIIYESRNELRCNIGIRIMPIDEAEGLGSNYEMLHELAKKEQYQIVTMSIETAGDINDEGQYIYIMHDNKDANGLTYVPPLGIFHKGQLTENIDEIFGKNT